jgi:hypothetical protein
MEREKTQKGYLRLKKNKVRRLKLPNIKTYMKLCIQGSVILMKVQANG